MTMPGPIESMAEYLVKIGWDVDELGLDKAVRKVKNFENGFVKSIANISSAIVELVSETAKLDLAQERMARQYWISEQAARSLSTSLDALGISYDDLFYATDEQYARFLNLNNYAKQLESATSSDVDKTLVKVRDIQFEFSKMKVWFTYFTREVVYQISKYIDLDKARKNIKYINDLLMKNLPKIAEWVGKIFSWVWRLGSTGLKVIYTLLKNIFSILGVDGVAAIGLIGGAIKLLKLGPLGWLIFALTSLLLLVEDFMTWKSGGKSALGDLWEQMSKSGGAFDSMKQTLPQIKELVSNILELFWDLGSAIGGVLDAIASLFGYDSGWSLLADLIKGAFDIINGVLLTATILINGFVAAAKFLTGDQNAWKEFSKKTNTGVYNYLKSIGLDDAAEAIKPDSDSLFSAKEYQNAIANEKGGIYKFFNDIKNAFSGVGATGQLASGIDLLTSTLNSQGSYATTTINNNVTVNSSSGNANDIARTTRDTLNDMASNRNWRLAIQG